MFPFLIRLPTPLRAQPPLSFQARKLVSTEGTLVVAPVSLVGQWEAELRDKCGDKVKIVRWYGQRRERDPEVLAAMGEDEGQALVVLTTFETLGAMHSRAPERLPALEAALRKKEEAAAKGAEAKAAQERLHAKAFAQAMKKLERDFNCGGEVEEEEDEARVTKKQKKTHRCWALHSTFSMYDCTHR